MVTSAGAFFLHQNARADVCAVTDSAGTVVERRFYDDFGRAFDGAKQPVAGSSVGNPYGFQGRRLDPETGLFFFRQRYYDPETGRFLQRDPVWDAGNVGGQYSFVGNGPVSRVDPWGTQLQELKDVLNARSYEEGAVALTRMFGKSRLPGSQLFTLLADKYVQVRGGVSQKVKRVVRLNARIKAATAGPPSGPTSPDRVIQGLSSRSTSGVDTIREVGKAGTDLQAEATMSVVGAAGYRAWKGLPRIPKSKTLRYGKRYPYGRHPVTKVQFDKYGYPDFKRSGYSPLQYRLPRDRVVGSRDTHRRYLNQRLAADVRAGKYKKLGLSEEELQAMELGCNPKEWRWHHARQKGIVQLVDRWAHEKTGHEGGFKVWADPDLFGD
jgi:RHS repeat-associated protein